MAPLRGLRRHAGRGALLPLPSRRAPRSGAVAVGEEDPRVGCRLCVHRPPDEPADRTLSRERRPRPVRQGAREGGAEIRRQSGGREAVPRLRLPAHSQRTVSEGLHPHRESGRGDRSARAPEQAPHRRVLPVEVQRRRGRVLPHRRVHGRMEDLADRSATELARLVRSREVSPVEVIEACLARVERYNPAVNAVVTLNPRALDDAGDLELRLVRGEEVGLLAGLPVGIKDVTPVAGLRTTYGSALYRDYVPAEDALVVRRLRDAGAVARTAGDVALMLQAVAGPSPLAPLAQPTAGRNFVAAAARRLPPGLRVAYCPDVAGIGIHPAIEQVCRRAAVGLGELHVEVDEIELDLSFGRRAFLALRGLWFVAQMFPRMDQLDRFGANVAGNIRAGLDTTTRELGAAEATRGRMWHLFREFFGRFDHLLTPCMAVPPFPVDQNYPETVAGKKMETYVDWIAPTFVLSLTGLPVASVPCGLDPDGLPVGLQIVGKPFGEETVLALASQVQRLHPIGRPPLLREAMSR